MSHSSQKEGAFKDQKKLVELVIDFADSGQTKADAAIESANSASQAFHDFDLRKQKDLVEAVIKFATPK